MAVHITIYPDECAAAALRQFMAERSCSATAAVELLLEEHETVVGREHRNRRREATGLDDPLVEPLHDGHSPQ